MLFGVFKAYKDVIDTLYGMRKEKHKLWNKSSWWSRDAVMPHVNFAWIAVDIFET